MIIMIIMRVLADSFVAGSVLAQCLPSHSSTVRYSMVRGKRT